MTDMCDTETKYAKRMRDLAGTHLKTYQKTHSKVSHHKHAERTKHQAMMKLLQAMYSNCILYFRVTYELDFSF